MQYKLKTTRHQATISVYVITDRPQKIRIAAIDNHKPYTTYTNRGGWVNGKRRFDLPLPQSPDELKIHVFNEKNGWKKKNDASFKVVKFGVNPLRTWMIGLTVDDKEAIEFFQQFSENAGILKSSPEGLLYESRNGKFKIRYLDKITDGKGKVLNMPARISNKTAVIEISKASFMRYSVAMRMIILLHEYSHYYKNKDIRNEVQADLNGLYIYLGLGYSPIEAHRAFLTVFSKADTAQNELRYQMIKKYIEDFYAGKIASPNEYQQKQLKKAS